MSISLKKERGDRQCKSYLVSSVIFSILFLSFVSFSSASTFGYNYLDNKISGNKTIINNDTYNYYNYTVNNTVFDNTQFDITGEDVSISTSWLTSFINGISKWSDYYTKTQSDDKYVPYNNANDNVNLGAHNLTANRYSTTLNTSVGVCTNSSGDIFFGYIDGAC
jgi:hypothetical protein